MIMGWAGGLVAKILLPTRPMLTLCILGYAFMQHAAGRSCSCVDVGSYESSSLKKLTNGLQGSPRRSLLLQIYDAHVRCAWRHCPPLFAYRTGDLRDCTPECYAPQLLSSDQLWLSRKGI